MEENRLSNISKADSDEKIGEFWDNHDFTDFDTDAPDALQRCRRAQDCSWRCCNGHMRAPDSVRRKSTRNSLLSGGSGRAFPGHLGRKQGMHRQLSVAVS